LANFSTSFQLHNLQPSVTREAENVLANELKNERYKIHEDIGEIYF
jgi:hypothetical protein